MSTSLSQTVRCPQCSAQVRTGTDWCTLCFANLRPAPAVSAAPVTPQPEPVAESATGCADEPARESVFGELAAAPLRRGKHSRSQTSDTAAIAVNVDALAEQMLAELAASYSGNVLGPAAFLVNTRAKRAGVTIGGALLASMLILLVATVLGKVF